MILFKLLVTFNDLGRETLKIIDNTSANERIRITAISGWSILVPSVFELINNGDSWQAYNEDRVIYVSAIEVLDSNGHKTPAKELNDAAALALGQTGAQSLQHKAEAILGIASIGPMDNGMELKGFMCAAGSLATCVIDFPSEQEKDWAISTWRSLEFDVNKS